MRAGRDEFRVNRRWVFTVDGRVIRHVELGLQQRFGRDQPPIRNSIKRSRLTGDDEASSPERAPGRGLGRTRPTLP
jgi:hypothetical protein